MPSDSTSARSGEGREVQQEPKVLHEPEEVEACGPTAKGMMWKTEKDETREKRVAMQPITWVDVANNARLKRERAERCRPAPCRAVRRARREVKAVRCSKSRRSP